MKLSTKIKFQTEEIVKYHDDMCKYLLTARRECQVEGHGKWVEATASHFEGRVAASRHIAIDIMRLPRELFDNGIYIS
jgi:hypothetical protein